MLRVGVLAQAPGGPLTSSACIRLLLPLWRLEQQGACAVVQLEPTAMDDAPTLTPWQPAIPTSFASPWCAV